MIWPALVLACGVGLVWGASLSLVTLAGGSYTEVLIEALICVAPTLPVAGVGLVQPWRRRGFGVVVRSGYLCMLLVAVWVAWGCAARLLH
ncbi:MAG: hypothetical protein R3F62_03270 [Planctomycetota bacterium]